MTSQPDELRREFHLVSTFELIFERVGDLGITSESSNEDLAYLVFFCIWQMGLTKMEETKSRAYSSGTQSGELESSAGMGSWDRRCLI